MRILTATALALATAFATTGPLRAQDLDEPSGRDVRAVGASDLGEVSIDLASRHNHARRGYARVISEVALADPLSEDGRQISKVRQTQDWDCAGHRLRTVRKTWRTDEGQLIRSELGRAGWAPIAGVGPEARAWALICPKQAAAAAQAAGAAPKTGAQVIEMPRR